MKRVFVANRGEIALRIVRACREVGLESVVGFSEADRDGLVVRAADRAVCIGPGPAANRALLVSVLGHPDFRAGGVTTEWLERALA